MQTVTVKLLSEQDELPYSLLLLADQSIAAIDKYITSTQVYVLCEDHKQVGVCAVELLDFQSAQIMNFAIQTDLQGKGLGRFFMHYITSVLKSQGIHEVFVGTNTCGVKQISFYKATGFAEYKIIENYFYDNYAQPIVEHGVRLKDMLLLKKTL